MKKRPTGILPIISYLIYTIVGFVLSRTVRSNLDALGESAADATFGGIAASIVLVLAMIYSVVAILPLLLKAAHLSTRVGLFGVFCMLFDLAYSIIHGALLYSAMMESVKDNTAILAYGVLFVISVTALLTNAKSVSK